MFVHILLAEFLSLSTCFLCFRLAWLLSCQKLERACIDYFLSKLLLGEMADEEEGERLDGEGVDSIGRYSMLIEYAIGSLRQSNLRLEEEEIEAGSETDLSEHFKKSLKTALSEIIKK